MLVNHDITIDLTAPGTAPRIHVKQGDAYSRNIRIHLLENGQPWMIPDTCTALIRYRAYDPETQTEAQGAFDLLEDGLIAYMIADNMIELMPANAVMALRGLVTMDVVLMQEDWRLATFNFEILIDQPPVHATQASAEGSYYKISSLEAINREFTKLRSAIEALGGTVE